MPSRRAASRPASRGSSTAPWQHRRVVVGVSQGTELVFLFVVLPFIVAALIVPLVQRRSISMPPQYRTSHLLREGVAARATLLEWKSPAQSFLDRHPMVTFRV